MPGAYAINVQSILYNEKHPTFIRSFQFILTGYGFNALSDAWAAMYQAGFSSFGDYSGGLHQCYGYIRGFNWRIDFL
jgi:hypothetical protein